MFKNLFKSETQLRLEHLEKTVALYEKELTKLRENTNFHVYSPLPDPYQHWSRKSPFKEIALGDVVKQILTHLKLEVNYTPESKIPSSTTLIKKDNGIDTRN